MERCAQLARQACRRVQRDAGAPSGDKVPNSRREDAGEAGPSFIASACSRRTMMAPSVVHHLVNGDKKEHLQQIEMNVL
jgi:hypothetical protein